MEQYSNLVFKVRRQQPELLAPARPTTHECKFLSDIDDQEGLRFQIPVIQFYRYNPMVMKGRDPVKVIRDAISEALVFYYPFAGRLREGPGRKLVVDCTGEGICFIGADADVRLSDFGDTVQPPFPFLEEVLYDVPGSDGILDCPLLLIQVTRLKCGGFIFALRLNHTMSDASGLVNFMSAIGEIARGAKVPSIKPVWQRHLLNARDEPRVSCTHNEYAEVVEDLEIISTDNIVHRAFFFGPAEVSALRKFVPPHLHKCSTFNLIVASIWRCRTISLQLDPNTDIRLCCNINCRTKITPPLPIGYYGNAFVFPAAVTKAGNLSKNHLGYAIELVMKVKSDASEEYIKSVADLMVTRGRPIYTMVQTFFVSDTTRAGFDKVDFGWGSPIYGGPAKFGMGTVPGMINFYVPFTNKTGEKGIIFPTCLPAPAMKIFERELDGMLKDNSAAEHTPSSFIVSNM